jgi:hypothetical protein
VKRNDDRHGRSRLQSRATVYAVATTGAATAKALRYAAALAHQRAGEVMVLIVRCASPTRRAVSTGQDAPPVDHPSPSEMTVREILGMVGAHVVASVILIPSPDVGTIARAVPASSTVIFGDTGNDGERRLANELGDAGYDVVVVGASAEPPEAMSTG